MSLLWIHAVHEAGPFRRTAAEKGPWVSKQDLRPHELSLATEPMWHELASGGDRAREIGELQRSIGEHGYDPARHGELHLHRYDVSFHKIQGVQPGHSGNGTERHGENLAVALNLHNQQAPGGKYIYHVPVTVHEHEDPTVTKYFHGTNRELEYDDVLRSGGGRSYGWPSSPHHTCATTDMKNAENYAQLAQATYGGRQRVYQVHPIDPGDIEDDENPGAGYGAVRSRAGWRIGTEVARPRELHEFLSGSERHHDDDDWDDEDYWGDD